MSGALLEIGASALGANQAALATASHNIANAGTQGYTRQEAVLRPAGANWTPSGFFGSGVQVETVRRQWDAFLGASVLDATAQQSSDAVRASGLEQLDAVFANTDTGVGAAMDAMFSAASDIAMRPADLPARQSFLAAAGQFAWRVETAASQIGGIIDDTQARLSADARSLNQSVAQVAALNDEIARAEASGQPANDLRDRREQALQTLGALAGVRVLRQDDGRVSLFLAGGQPLLVGQRVSTLQALPDAADPQRLGLALRVDEGDVRPIAAAALGGGSLGGALALRDNELAPVLQSLRLLARDVAGSVNAQQALGIDLDGQVGQPVFTIGAGGELTLTGLNPRQVAAASPAALADPGADNRNALALAGLRRLTLSGGATPAATYAGLVADVGLRVRAGRDTAALSSAARGELVARQQQAGGVNLDEEAASLLRFQQAYQASARILQASQALFDALLSATAR